MTKTLDPRTVNLVATLNAMAGAMRPTEYKGIYHMAEFGAEPGMRYDRIWTRSTSIVGREGMDEARRRLTTAQRSVKCFVDRQTGEILYSQGWKSPAKWKTGPGGTMQNASEFHTDESDLYALAVSEGLWGYKGDRAAWEKKRGV